MEIQVDARNFVRLGPDSVLRVVTLREEGIALSLSEGTATLRLARFNKDKEYFELDAPGTTVAAEKTGLYRLDVDRDGAVRVTVRDDGRARLYSQDSGFVLRNNRTARLAGSSAGEREWEFASVAGFDQWDQWNDERERYLASRLRHEGRERYYDTDVYGAEELDTYGDWSYTNDYGYVWSPHTTVINNYYDWAPYRYGRWAWVSPYGWTWVADEPWGWAPYHYGRWVYINGRWCWAPRGYGYSYRRAWWRPALVVFVTLDFGRDRHVCWYPLTHGQRDPRGRWWSRGSDRLRPLGGRDVGHLRRSNPAFMRAVTTLPARDFGTAALRARPAAGDLAQRALAGEPVQGQLPIQRAGSRGVARPDTTTGRARPTGANGRDVLTINRPPPANPARAVPDRPTGAAARTPGVSLDGELRRTRVFNNREPRVPMASAPPEGSEGSGSLGRDAGATGGTGAVERPRAPGSATSGSGGFGDGRTRPARVRPTQPDSPIEPAAGTPTGDEAPARRREDDSAPRRARPARPPDAQPRGDDSNSQPMPRYEPRVRPREDGGERSTPPARREEPAPRRDDPPVSRPERTEPRESPRTEPRREEPRPEPRREEPRREEPRPEPKHEAPRQDPPRQEAPRQEAPRQEAPRQEAPRQSPPSRDTPRPESPRRRDRP
jgi:hypothetical protein